MGRRLDTVTSRELEVLGLLAEGRTVKVAARRLGISFHTVKNHVASVRRKLGVRSTLQAALICLKAGLFDTNPIVHRKARAVTPNCEEFCVVCSHGVYSLEKHLQTEEHRRNAKREKNDRAV